jgi:hypothetical protein
MQLIWYIYLQLHLWWIDDRTLAGLTRPWYIHAMPFPKSLLYVRQRQKAAEARVWLPQGESATFEAGADKVKFLKFSCFLCVCVNTFVNNVNCEIKWGRKYNIDYPNACLLVFAH